MRRRRLPVAPGGAQAVELDEKLFIELHPALWVRVNLYHPTLHTIGKELFIPRGIERVGEIDAFAVAADLDHLRTAVERLPGFARVGGAAHDAAEMERAGFFRVGGIRDVVLDKFAGSPARNVEEAVVERKVDIGDQGRHRLEAFEQGRKLFRVGRLGGNFDHLADRPLTVLAAIFAMPHPNRGRKILQRNHHTNKTICLFWIVRWTQFEHHLLLRSQIQFLQMAPLVQIPDMHLVTVLAGQQQLGVEAILHHVRCAPFRSNHGVVPQMPPEIVRQLLRTTILFPLPLQLEGVRIHQENAAGAVSAGRSKGAPIDAVWSAMNRVGRRVAGLADEFFRLDHLHDLWLFGISLRIQDVNPRRSDAGNDQVATFHVGMRSLRTEASAAGVPAEMVQFIVAAGKVGLPDHSSVFGGTWVKINDAHGIPLSSSSPTLRSAT